MKTNNILAMLVASGLGLSAVSLRAQQDTSPPASPSQSGSPSQNPVSPQDRTTPQEEQRVQQHNLPAGELDSQGVRSQDRIHTTPQTSRDLDRSTTLVTSPHAYVKMSQIIGHEVKDSQGQRLGKVQDIVMNIASPSSPAVAIVAYGGALGIGETRVAMPLKELTWSGTDKTLTLAATKEQLQSASQTRSGGWAMIGGDEWSRNVDRFYGDFTRTDVGGMDRDREFVRDPAQNRINDLNSPSSPPQDNLGTGNPTDR